MIQYAPSAYENMSGAVFARLRAFVDHLVAILAHLFCQFHVCILYKPKLRSPDEQILEGIVFLPWKRSRLFL